MAVPLLDATMRRFGLRIAGFVTLVLILTSVIAQASSEALVKIYVVRNAWDYTTPWQKSGPASGTGSGVILSGNRILTCAHVVADAASIEVKRAGQSQRYSAQVAVAGHECDLALLKLDEAAFFEDVEPLALGELPNIEDPVEVHGFPVGGENVSVTSGIVSRIEVGTYVHSLLDLLQVQIDAAVNPGNSGGPILAQGKVVGVASQTLPDSENIGYIVPSPVIEHFLEDASDGVFDGFPRLEAGGQTLENEHLRASLEMPDAHSGVLVGPIAYRSPAHTTLRYGDVLLSIDGHDIANDGTVGLRGSERIDFSHVYLSKFVGETVDFGVWRRGKLELVTMPLEAPHRLVPQRQHDRPPTYFVYGGLVFQRLTMEYILLFEDIPSRMQLFGLDENYTTRERQELVVVSSVLGHRINRSYENFAEYIVDSVDDKIPATFAEFVLMIEAAEGPFVSIGLEDTSVLVFDVEEARRVGPEILQTYGVPRDRSPDLVRSPESAR